MFSSSGRTEDTDVSVRAALGGPVGNVLKQIFSNYIQRKRAGRDAANAAYAMMQDQLGSGLGRAVVNSGKIVF